MTNKDLIFAILEEAKKRKLNFLSQGILQDCQQHDKMSFVFVLFVVSSGKHFPPSHPPEADYVPTAAGFFVRNFKWTLYLNSQLFCFF